MAVFKENIENSEEKVGGFDPNQADDETFMLEKLDEYPGELPVLDFSKKEPDIAPSNADDGVSEAEIIEVQEGGSIWDAFEDNQAEDESQDEFVEVESEEVASEVEETNEVVEEIESMPKEMEVSDDDFVSSMFEDRDSLDDEAADENQEFGKIDNKEIDNKEEYIDDVARDKALDEADIDVPDINGLKPEEEYEIPALMQSEIDEKVFDASESLVDETESEPEIESKQDDLVDEDFQRLIQSELERSKKRKQSQPKEEKRQELSVQQMAEKLSEFKAVETLGAAQEIDLTGMDAVHPSTYGLTAPSEVQSEIDKSGAQKAKAAKIKEAKKNEAKKQKKEKKERKPIIIPWIRIALIAAILIVLLGMGGGIYYFNLVDKATNFVTNIFVGTSDSTDVAVEADSVTTTTDKEVETVAMEDEVVDSSEVEIKSELAKQVEVEKTPAKVEKTPAKVEKTPAKVEKTPAKVVESPKPRREAITTRPRVARTQRTETETETKDIARSKIETENLARQSIVTTEIREIATSFSDDKDAIYVIQVFSSPNKEDAESWKRRLTALNITGVTISEQLIRDRVWYRVRFGAYKTKDEAKSIADRYGFSQTWIDRIK